MVQNDTVFVNCTARSSFQVGFAFAIDVIAIGNAEMQKRCKPIRASMVWSQMGAIVLAETVTVDTETWAAAERIA